MVSFYVVSFYVVSLLYTLHITHTIHYIHYIHTIHTIYTLYTPQHTPQIVTYILRREAALRGPSIHPNSIDRERKAGGVE